MGQICAGVLRPAWARVVGGSRARGRVITAGPALQAGDGVRPALERFLGPSSLPYELSGPAPPERGHPGWPDGGLHCCVDGTPSRTGFRYEIVSRSGSPAVQSLAGPCPRDGGPCLGGWDDGVPATLVRAHYGSMMDISGEGGLVRVGIRPNREAPMLLKGAMFLQPDTGDALRVEGRLVKRPSFWTRRVDIVRHYARIAGAFACRWDGVDRSGADTRSSPPSP